MKIVGLDDVQLVSHEAIIRMLERSGVGPRCSDPTVHEIAFRKAGSELLQPDKIDHGVVVFVWKRIGRIPEQCSRPSQRSARGCREHDFFRQ